MAEVAAARKLLTVPADRAAVDRLARAYRNPVLGDIVVRRDMHRTTFDFGEFKSEVGTIKNPDGTVKFLNITPGGVGAEFVVGEANGKPTLTTRDGQHEYVFEAK